MGQTFLTQVTLVPGAAYLRGKAYLQAHNGSAAALEFQKIIDHHNCLLNPPLVPLARLGQARAYVLAGEKDKCRTAYQDFLGFWKNADPDIPVRKQAQAERAKLQ